MRNYVGLFCQTQKLELESPLTFFLCFHIATYLLAYRHPTTSTVIAQNLGNFTGLL